MHRPVGNAPARGRRVLRVFARLAMVLVVCASLLPMSTPANAALYNLMPAGPDGLPQETFRTNEVLYATMTSDLFGGMVCVVEADVTHPSEASCNSPAWGSPNTYISVGTLLGMPLEGPMLAVGTWRLLATDTSGQHGTSLSVPFTVLPCTGDCPTGPAEQELQRWKDRAAAAKGNMMAVCVGAQIWNAGSALSAGRGMYKRAGGGRVGLELGVPVGAINYFLPTSTAAGALAILKHVSCTAEQMYRDIENDPPDFDYATPVVPQLEEYPSTGDAEVDALAVAWDTVTAYGDASRIAFERYQGAMIDDEQAHAAAQAAAAADFTFEMVRALREVQRLTPAVASKPYLTSGAPTEEEVARIQAVVDRLRADGHTPEEIEQLTALGFDAETIQQIEDDYDLTSPSDLDRSRSLGEQLGAYAGTIPAIIEDYDAFGRQLSAAAAELAKERPNQRPTASFTQTATSGEAPLTVTFTSTSTDPDGDDLALTWDIGGIASGTGEEYTYTFTTPGTYEIGLIASDGELSHQAVSTVNVTSPGSTNRPPVASFTQSEVPGSNPLEVTFTSTSTDPDGDDLTHTWYFGDGEVLEGDVVTRTFERGYVYSVQLVVSDGLLSSSSTGEVRADPPPANSAPVASFTTDTVEGRAPLTVRFIATSTDPDGDELTHTWHFGDGVTATGASVEHTYTTPNTYRVVYFVSDGVATDSAARDVVVTPAAPVLRAELGTSQGYDAAKLANGARVVDVSSVATSTSWAAENILRADASTFRTGPGEVSDQYVIVELAGGGGALVERASVAGVNSSFGLRDFELSLSATGTEDADFAVVATGQAERGATPTTVTFEPQRARYAKLRLVDAHAPSGSNQYITMSRLDIHTVDRDGGIVSVPTGGPLPVATATSEHPSHPAAQALLENTQLWQTAAGDREAVLDVELGSEGAHRIDRLVLQVPNSTTAVREFTLSTSPTGAAGTWTQVLAGDAERTNVLQEFSFPPTDARFVRFEVHGNHGHSSATQLQQLRILTTDGLNVANAGGVGAHLFAASGTTSNVRAVLDPTTTSGWITGSGANSDEHIGVLLRGGRIHTIDSVMVQSSSYRPRLVEVLVSTSGAEDSWRPVATRELLNVSDDQWIHFPAVEASHVVLRVHTGYGSRIGVNQFRVNAADRGSAEAMFADRSTPGESGITSRLWDFGDGTTSALAHPRHTFPGPGTYQVTLTVTDAEGAMSTATMPYTVIASTVPEVVPPASAVDDDGNIVANEGSSVRFDASLAGHPALRWRIHRGYGTVSESQTSNFAATYPDDGTYEVRVEVLNADLVWTSSPPRTVTVANVPPNVSMGATQDVYALESVAPTVTVTDPGSNDVVTCVWTWGDGTVSDPITPCAPYAARIGHTYDVPGTYTATLRASDEDGGVTEGTLAVTVRARPTYFSLASVAEEGDEVTVGARLIDGRSAAALSDREVTGTIGGTTTTATTDAEGLATLTFPASAGDRVELRFAGTVAHLPTTFARDLEAPRADVVFVIDESASMGSYQTAIRESVSTIVQGLGEHLDFRVGLVGYAGGHTNGHAHVIRPLVDDPRDFSAGMDEVRVVTASANAYDGVVKAMSDDMGFRQNAAVCAVLISDAAVSEVAQSNPTTTPEEALAALEGRRGTLFGFIHTNAATQEAYGAPLGMAGLTGGTHWPVGSLAANTQAVLDELATGCVTAALLPDLAIAKTGPADVLAPDSVAEYQIRVDNPSAVRVHGIELVDVFPAGVTPISASDGGTVTGQEVSWPAFSLAPGEERFVSVQARTPSGMAVGEHEYTNTATITFDDGDGAPTSRTAEHTIVVRVDPAAALAIDLRHDEDAGVEGGDAFDLFVDVANPGTADTTDTVVLVRIPDRFSLRSVSADGWQNPTGGVQLGQHPDGLEGDWLHLEGHLSAGAEETFVLRLETAQLPTSPVTRDEGSLDEALPAIVPPLVDELEFRACAAASNVAGDECADEPIALRDLDARVHVRLADGATSLVVSVRTTAALEGEPVTLLWQPLDAAGAPVPDAEPVRIRIDDVATGELHVLEWPGVVRDAEGVATGWTAFRAITEDDLDDEGWLLDPATGERFTEAGLLASTTPTLVLDPAHPVVHWRGRSEVTFTANPGQSFRVEYAERLPAAWERETEPTPTPEPTPDPTSTPTPEPTPTREPTPTEPLPTPSVPAPTEPGVTPPGPTPSPAETITPSPAPPRPGLPSTGGGADSMALLLLGLGATVLGARALRRRR